MSPAKPAHRRGRMRRWLLRSGRGLEAAQGRPRCPLVLGSIPWPAAPEPRGFPAEIPLGLQGREIFYGTGKKKKKLCQRVLALPAPPPCPASARGPGGGPCPPSLLLAHGRGCGVRDPALGPSQIPGSQPGSCQGVTQEHRGKLRQEMCWGWQHHVRSGEGAPPERVPPAPPGRAQGSEPGFSP